MASISGVKVLMLKGEKGDVGNPTDGQVQAQIAKWISENPESTIDKEATKEATKTWLDENGVSFPDGHISNAMIADGAVTTEKLANSSVDTEKLLDGAVTAEKIDTTLFLGGGKLLWTNSSTNTSFLEQDIEIDANYDPDYLLIVYSHSDKTNSTGGKTIIGHTIVFKADTTVRVKNVEMTNNGVQLDYRDFKYTQGNLHVYGGYGFSYNSSLSGGNDSTAIKPIFIYGFKLSV